MASRRSGLQILAKESRIECALVHSWLVDVFCEAWQNTELPFENQAKCRKRLGLLTSSGMGSRPFRERENGGNTAAGVRIFVGSGISKLTGLD